MNAVLKGTGPMLLIWGEEHLVIANDWFVSLIGRTYDPPFLGTLHTTGLADLLPAAAACLPAIGKQNDADGWPAPGDMPHQNKERDSGATRHYYSPVIDEQEVVRGVLVLCLEGNVAHTRYRNIVESATGPIMIFKGHELIVEDANAATLELWNADRSVIGRPFLEVKPEFRDQGFPEMIREVLRTGKPFTGFEYPAVFARDGGVEELHYYNFEYTAYRETDGEITGVVVLAIDVTEQVLGKKQLSIAEEEMHVAVAAANLGYWNLDPVRNTFQCNSRTRELFGLPDKEDVDLNLAIQNIHADDRDRVVAAIQSALSYENNGRYDCEYRVLHPQNGALLTLKAIGRSYRNAGGEVIRLSGTVQDFTQVKAAEEELRRQMRFSESLLEASPSLTYIYDLERDANSFASSQVEQILGYTKDEVLAMGSAFLPAILHPEEAGVVEQHFNAIVGDERNGIHELEYRAKRKDGCWIWLYDRSRVFERNAAGDPIKILGIATDITERKNLELLLSSQFEELETVYRTAPVGLCLLNRDLLFIRINDRLAEINGVPIDEHVGRSIFEVVPDLAPQAAPLLRQVLDTGMPLTNIEIKGQTKARPGIERIWNESWYPVRSKTGEVIAVSVVAQEITEQRQALEALQASEARFQNLVRDTTAAIIVLTGAQMNVEIVNKAYGRLVGLEPEDMLGKPLFDLIPDAEAYYRPILEGVYQTGEPLLLQDTPYAVTTNGIRYDGFLHVVYQPYRNEAGNTLGVMAIIQDVTESVRARKALEESEIRFRALVEQSPVATCLFVGRELIIELANEKMIRSWGKDASVIGKPLAVALPEMEGQPYLGILDDVFTSGKEFNAVAAPAQLVVDGIRQTFYYNFNLKPLLNENGGVYAIINTAVDVTSEVTAKLNLEESEKRYRRLIESNIAGVLFWDLDIGITEANEAFLKMIGYERADFQNGLHGDQITPEQWREQDAASIAELLETGRNAPFEKQYIHKNGSLVDVLIANTALEGTGNRQGVTFVLDITNQKRSEVALRESESRFRSLADDAPAFIFLANANAQIEYINQTWIRFTGLPPEEAIGQGWATITHPDDLQRSFDIFNHAFETRTDYQYEMQQKGGDGAYHWIHWRGIPRFLPNGEFLGILGFGFDITEQKKSEDALRASEELFRSFGDNIQNLAWIADGAGWIYWYNQRWYDYTGTTYEEMQGWGWEKMHHPEHKERVLAFVAEAWKRPEAWELTFPLRSAAGEFQWFLTRAVPVLAEDGTISRWIGTNTNINEQKLLSDNLEGLVAERTEALSQSRAFLQAVLNSAQTTISTFEAIRDSSSIIIDFRLTYVNNTITDDMGQAAGKLVGQTCREAFPHIFSTGEFEKFVKCVEAAQTIQYETRYERDGVATWYYVSLAKMGDGLTATSLNVTKEREATEQLSILNRELDDRNRQLQRSNEDLQQFAHVASHDLKEPVRKIRTFSSRLKDEFAALLPERGLSFLSRIEKGADRMYDMIDGVLLYSSIDAMKHSQEEVFLNEVLDNIKTDLELVIQKRDAVITAGQLPSVEGVPILIYQLFYNLINNALKFGKADQHPKIELRAEVLPLAEAVRLNLPNDRPFVQITVRDNGIGFDPEASEHIFQTFTRLNAKDKYEGTGLGLSLCRKIAERHGGRIWADGALGVGATFYIVLPKFESV